jgi:hypothetical protein
LPADFILELSPRGREFRGLRAYQARHPVIRAQMVNDGAVDSAAAVGFKSDSTRRIECVDGADKTEHSNRSKVIVFNVVRQTVLHLLRDSPYQR